MSEHNAPKEVSEVAKQEAKRNITFIIPVLLLVLLIAGVGYFTAMHSGLDKAAVDAALKSWSEQLKSSSTKNGSAPIVFVYDSVEMEGGPSDRHAVLINPAFSTQAGTHHTVVAIKTSKAYLYPTSVTFDAMRIELPEPLMIQAEDKVAGNIRFDKPLIINTKVKTEEKTQYVEAKIDVPSNFTAESYADEKNYAVTLDAGATASFLTSTDGKSYGSTVIAATNVVVSSEEKTVLAVSKLNLEVTDKPAAKPDMVAEKDTKDKLAEHESHAVVVKADIQELSLKEQEMPYGALTFLVDVNYEGPLPNNQNNVDWSSTAAKLMITQLQIKNADAYLSVKGNLLSGQGDMLPTGQMNVNVGNFEFIRNEILKHGLIAEAEIPMMNVLFEQMTGQAFDKAKDLELVLTREVNKSLKLGNITLEQGLAIVLSHGKMSPKKIQNNDAIKAPCCPTDAPAAATPDVLPEALPEPEAEPEAEQPEGQTHKDDVSDEAHSYQFMIQ